MKKLVLLGMFFALNTALICAFDGYEEAQLSSLSIFLNKTKNLFKRGAYATKSTVCRGAEGISAAGQEVFKRAFNLTQYLTRVGSRSLILGGCGFLARLSNAILFETTLSDNQKGKAHDLVSISQLVPEVAHLQEDILKKALLIYTACVFNHMLYIIGSKVADIVDGTSNPTLEKLSINLASFALGIHGPELNEAF